MGVVRDGGVGGWSVGVGEREGERDDAGAPCAPSLARHGFPAIELEFQTMKRQTGRLVRLPASSLAFHAFRAVFAAVVLLGIIHI